MRRCWPNKGNLEHPQLEWSKISEFRWVSRAEIELLKENRLEGDTFVYEVVKKGLELAAKASSKMLQEYKSVPPQNRSEDFRAVREEFEQAVAEEVIQEDQRS